MTSSRPVLRFVAGAALSALLLLSPESAAGQGPAPDGMSGVWDLVVADPDRGDRTGRLSLLERYGLLSGRVDWDDGSAVNVSGRRRGADLELRIATFTGVGIHLQGSLSVDRSEMSGEFGDAGAWMAFLDVADTRAPAAGGRAEAPPVAGPPGAVSRSPADRRIADGRGYAPATPPGARAAPGRAEGPRISAPDIETGAEQAVSNLADDLAAGADLETAARSFESDAVEVVAQEAGRQAAEAVSEIASDALARGAGSAAYGAVGSGLREALDLQGASGQAPLEAAGQALADAAVGVAAEQARREITEAAADVVKEELADDLGRAAGGVLGQTLGNAVDGGRLLGGLFGRGGDADPDRGAAPAEGLLSGRWRFVVLESRGDQVVTHAGVLDLTEDGHDVTAAVRWSGTAPAFLPAASLAGERDELRISVRAGDSGPVLRGVVDAEARRMGGYVSSGGFLGLWQAVR